jgi:hypothetical protein
MKVIELIQPFDRSINRLMLLQFSEDEGAPELQVINSDTCIPKSENSLTNKNQKS